MQLDNTLVVVRERGFIDTLDLSLHVMRTLAPGLFATLALAIVPTAVLDYFLVGWMDERLDWEIDGPPMRYLWNYTLLVFLQAPAVSVFATAYLGAAIFKQEKTPTDVLRDVRGVAGRLFICQIFLRGSLLATAMPLVVYGGEANWFLEGFMLTVLVFYVAVLRAFRPFINEIVILERNPLRTRDPNGISISRRSYLLHSVNGGDLFAQWLGASLAAVTLCAGICFSLFAMYALMSGDNDWTGFATLHVIYPLSLWLTAAFMTVVRFLNYLDLRIRQEGWEVELLLRAEANRFQEKPA